MKLTNKLQLVIALGAAIVAAAIYQLTEQRRDVSQAQPLPELRTVCVGRMLFDIPVDMEIQGDVEFYYGLTKDFQSATVQVVESKATQQDFDKVVKNRIAELSSRYEARTPTNNFLAAVRRIDDDTELILAHEEPAMKGYFSVEVFVRRGDAIGKLSRDVFPNDKSEDIEFKVLSLASRITAVGDPLRAGKGTCLGGLLINEVQDGEVFTISTRSTRYRDVVLGISMNSVIAKSDGGMLARVDRKADLLAKFAPGLRELRRGSTMIAGRPAEEMVTYGKNEAGKLQRQLDAETVLTEPSTFAQPQIHIDLAVGGQDPDTAEYVDPSFTEADTLKLWEMLIKSVRPRPGAI